ncbi:MAG TPA: mannosyltransferase family protein [Solirubrobacteraceae bacterium]|nr:mannosyltransferase family protein [Solirubrobacteraceae bacterium]
MAAPIEHRQASPAPARRAIVAAAGGRQAWRDVWVAVLASRLLVMATAAVASATLAVTKSPEAPRGKLVPGISHPFGHGWLAGVLDAVFTPLVRWDALWYLEISHHGYSPLGLVAHNPGQRPAFFPLYPLLVHVLGGFAGNGATVVAATLLSLIAFTVALVVVHRLTTLELGPRAAKGAVLVIAFWPSSYFFSAPYTESLFLALSAGAFLAARRERWWLAGLLGAAASATRNTGILLAIPLLVMYLYGPRGGLAAETMLAPARERWGRLRARYALRRDVLWLALVPLGLIAYSIYLQVEIGNWQAWRTVQTDFGRPHVTTPITTLHLAATGVYHALSGSGLSDPNLLDGFVLVVLAIALIGMAKRLPLPYTVWALISVIPALVTPFSGEALRSLPRFVAVLFPVAMWLGDALTRDGRRLLAPALVLGAAMLVGATIAFTTWLPFV